MPLQPCGFRRSYIRKPVIKTRISKKAVAELIASGSYECSQRIGATTDFKSYEGCENNLINILYDSNTTVKVAGRRSEYYVEGFRTVIMDAPCFPTIFLLRTKNEEEISN